MAFDKEYFNIGYIDRLSYRDTIIHRLDARVKVIATMCFIIAVISYPKYEVLRLSPFFLFPVLLITLSDTPFLFILKKIIIVSPFAVFIGIFNPLFDPKTVALSDGIYISKGWVSFLSIILKFTLTISAALLLIATTSFAGVCNALNKLGVPEIFTLQLLFLYRYIFVLMEEGMRIVRARDLRSFNGRGSGIKVFVSLIGVLFIRTVERANRIYKAMLSRGFNGKIKVIKKSSFGIADIIFLIGVLSALYIFRMYDITGALGRLLIRTV